MPREFWFTTSKELKNNITKITGKKLNNRTPVTRASQGQFKQISQDPKKYEDEKCPVPTLKTNDTTLATNFEHINLCDDTTFKSFKQQNGQMPVCEENENNDLIRPEYVVIATSLREKSEKLPDICSIPFFVHLNQNASPLSKSTSSAYVSLPYNIQEVGGNDLWKIIGRQLIKIKELCLQNGKLNFTEIFQSIVQVYHPDCHQRSNFGMLDRLDLESLLKTTLPIVVDQALSLPNLIENSIPLLLSSESKTIYLTRKLCCSLLANAFFCTFPEPKVGQMPDFNFFRLYNDTQSQRCEVKKEKIKCLLQYFRTMKNYETNQTFQNQIVSFERRFVQKGVHWVNAPEPLCEVHVEPYKKIEESINTLQVDFANKVVGGGVLNDGSVMEEIRFCISPELIVSRLFSQILNDHEVLVVTGTEIFSQYSGYSTSFCYVGPSNIDFEQHSLDNFGRTFTQVVAMDASSFKRNETTAQFQPKLIDRELHKAYVAFIHGKAGVSPVATGNWGCGAFNGNQELKFLIQWMAASHQGRPSIIYHTIGDKVQTRHIETLSAILRQKGVSVGGLYNSVSQFSRSVGNQNISTGALFKYVKQYFDDYKKAYNK